MSKTSVNIASALKPVSTVVINSQLVAPRLQFIDGLRGLAMIMVLLCHCWIFGGFWAIKLPWGAQTINAGPLLSYGYVGVNLFLVLSGFCLYWPFVKVGSRRDPTLWEFARKRCRRILPPYYVTLALFGTPLFLQALRHHSYGDFGFAVNWMLLHIFMLHNLNLDYVVRVDGALWTLALEFQLYILFPALVESYRRFNPRGVLLTALLASCAYRFIVMQGISNSEGQSQDYAANFVLMSSIFGRCFEFVLGMFAALVVSRWHTEKKSFLRWPDYLLTVVVILLSFIQDKHGYLQVLSDARWGLLAAALLLIGSRPGNIINRALSSRVLVSLGIFSYSVYLIHQPLVILLGKFGMRHFTSLHMALFEMLFVAPLMVLLGYLFHLAFERPFMTSTSVKSSATPEFVMAAPVDSQTAVKEFAHNETARLEK